MNFIKVLPDNLDLLKSFIHHIGDAAQTFRYFNTRNIEIIKQHIITLLLVKDGIPLAYGHLEQEGEDIWLGVCVSPSFAGKGYGKMMMEELISNAKQKGVSCISLTVDQTNSTAISLYEKLGFMKEKRGDSYYKYILQL